QLDRLDVVEVQANVDTGLVGQSGHRRGQRTDASTVEPNGVLADLYDDRAADPLRPGHHGLGVLQCDHVEGGDTTVAGRGRGHQLAGGYGRHQIASTTAAACSCCTRAGSTVPATGASTAAPAQATACASRSGHGRTRRTPADS